MTMRSAWLAVAAMFVMNGALFGIWASRVPAVAERFSLSHSQLGLLLLFMAGGAVCSFPFAGKAVDRQGAARITRLVAMIYPVCLIVLPMMPSFTALSVALFLFGASHGAMDVAMNGWAAEVERAQKRRMMSSFHAMFSLGAGIGALSGYLAVKSEIGLFSHFLWATALITLVAQYLASIPWTSVKSDSKEGPFFSLPSGPLLLVGIVAFCASLGEGAMADWSAVFLRDVALASESVAALGYASFSVAMVMVRLLGDRITSRLGPVSAARLGGSFAVIGSTFAVSLPGVYPVLIGFAGMGIGYAVVMPLAFSRAANDPNVLPGQAISSVATLGYGGMLLGPPLIGMMAGLINLQISFGLLAVLALLIALLAQCLDY